MGLDTMIRDSRLGSGAVETNQDCFNPPTPEEMEARRKSHEEHEAKRIKREVETLRLTTTIHLFRDAVANGFNDYRNTWEQARSATDFLFSQFEGITAESIDPYAVIGALRGSRH